MFTTEQKEQLESGLGRSVVRERKQGGRMVAYVEGWRMIEEANRIFGFDGWSRETVQMACVTEHERLIGREQKPGFSVSYIARVRIVVSAHGDLIIREGTGAGHGIDVDVGAAHESACKEAETDALKRALMTFGNQFGLALYDREQANVIDDSPRALYTSEAKTRIDTATNAHDLADWWNSDEQREARRFINMPVDDMRSLRALVLAKVTSLKPSGRHEQNDEQATDAEGTDTAAHGHRGDGNSAGDADGYR